MRRRTASGSAAVRKPGVKVVPAVLIDQAVKLLAKNPLHTAHDDDPPHPRTTPASTERAPEIILSESFSAASESLPS